MHHIIILIFICVMILLEVADTVTHYYNQCYYSVAYLGGGVNLPLNQLKNNNSLVLYYFSFNIFSFDNILRTPEFLCALLKTAENN